MIVVSDPSLGIAVADEKEVKKLQEKKKRIDRVMGVIREHGLDKDKEFMDEIDTLMEELLKND